VARGGKTLMTDYAEAIPMYVDRARVFIESNRPKWIVIHKTAGFHTAQEVAAYFATNAEMTSTHYVIGQDGTVVQCVREQDGAGGNCCLEPGHAPFLPTDVNLNLLTISIEHVDPTPDNSTPLTPAQKEASFRLIADICQRHGIPARHGDAAGGIIGHFELDPLSRARCPGNYPWSDLWAFLAEGGFMLDIKAASNFFVDLGNNVWRCPKTGYVIGHGILDFYRRIGGGALFGLTYLGLPLSNEIPIEGYSGVVLQRFERGVVCWDPDHLVDHPPGSGPAYLMHLDSGPGQDPRIARLQQEIASLQQELDTLKQELDTQELGSAAAPSTPSARPAPSAQPGQPAQSTQPTQSTQSAQSTQSIQSTQTT
jgi:N-acetyl-anhydromuramyl-L-alanine amidase AmpD